MVAALNMSVGEVVLSVMALASKKGKIEKFSYPSVFATFQKLREEYPDYFPIYFHYLAGGIPHSRKLENILFRLGVWGSILVTNPRFHYLEVNKEIVATIEDNIQAHYGEDVLDKLKELGTKFIDLVPKEEYEV